MKLYIPFNSNDYNNVFSTLSISPRSFYEVRDFGFKRATQSHLNPLEDALIGFKYPVFVQSEHDIDGGYTINIVIDTKDIKEQNGWLGNSKKESNQCFYIYDTVFLFSGFELLFRTESEKKEVEAKSLKSVETKFADIAKENSRIIDDEDEVLWFADAIKSNQLKGYTTKTVNRKSLKFERELNKIIGALFGFALGSQRNLPPVLRKLHKLSKELKNVTALFINRIGESNWKETKKKLWKILDLIESEFDEIKSVDNDLIEKSKGEISGELLDQLQAIDFEDSSYLDLIKEGIIAKRLDSAPIQLKVVRAKRIINSRFNAKYPKNFIGKVTKQMKVVQYAIEDQLSSSISESVLDKELLGAKIKDNGISFSGVDRYAKKEGEYLEQILNFFIDEDTIGSIDELHAERPGYLGDLGKYIKAQIKSFDGSEQREYLTELHSSFKDPIAKFNIDNIQQDCLKSIGLMFTKGRDFMQFREAVEDSSIVNKEIAYAIWGSAFGYAGLPKTLTETLFESSENKERILSSISEFLEKSTEPIQKFTELGSYSKFEKQSGELVEDSIEDENTDNIQKQKSKQEKLAPHDLLAPFLTKIDDLKRIQNKSKFKDIARRVFNEVEEEVKRNGELFDQPDVRIEKFDELFSEKITAVDGIGETSKDKGVAVYREIISKLGSS